MQIAIDIPDKDVPNKQEIIDISLHFIAGEVCECNYPYIVLPKGHGDLKDVDHYIKMQWEYPDYSLTDDEPTIIEAESEG